MYKTLLLLIISLIAATVSAQSKEEALTALENICNGAKGMTYYRFIKNEILLGQQSISKDSLTITERDITNKINRTTWYSNVAWEDAVEYTFKPINPDVYEVEVVFDYFINLEAYFIVEYDSGPMSDALQLGVSDIHFYIPASKQQEAQKYLDILKTK